MEQPYNSQILDEVSHQHRNGGQGVISDTQVWMIAQQAGDQEHLFRYPQRTLPSTQVKDVTASCHQNRRQTSVPQNHRRPGMNSAQQSIQRRKILQVPESHGCVDRQNRQVRPKLFLLLPTVQPSQERKDPGALQRNVVNDPYSDNELEVHLDVKK